MSKTLIAIMVLIVAIVGFRWWKIHDQSPAHAPGNPVTDLVGEDLKAKFQADIGVRIPSLDNQMKQMLALGTIDPAASKELLDDVGRLHADVDNAERQLVKLGDTQAQVSAWLAREQWNEFQQTEAQFRKAIAN